MNQSSTGWSLFIGLAVAAIAISFSQARAVVIDGFNVLDTSNLLDVRQPNRVQAAGKRDLITIDVLPVGTQPTPSADGTSISASQPGLPPPPISVPYSFSSALPNNFSISIPFNSSTTGPWTFRRRNSNLAESVARRPLRAGLALFFLSPPGPVWRLPGRLAGTPATTLRRLANRDGFRSAQPILPLR